MAEQAVLELFDEPLVAPPITAPPAPAPISEARRRPVFEDRAVTLALEYEDAVLTW